jgi:superfamily I DNA/RNA helicase
MFGRKAAHEMRVRLGRMMDFEGDEDVLVGTFHGICVK